MNRFNRARVPFLALALVLLVSISAFAGTAPKNVIVMIGDGMGVAQVALARVSQTDPGKRLAMDSMRYSGFARTYSANSAITDSAAAATALACGRKTDNGMIGVLPDKTPVASILELMQGAGKSVGLVTTVTITHATPAGFGAHVASRGDEADIAPQYINKKIDVLLGGGLQFFIPKSTAGSARKDDIDLIAKAKGSGYTVMTTRDELLAAKSSKLLGLFSPSYMTTVAPEPSVAEMATAAVNALSKDPDGFFLMVEGGQIDSKCHANDAEGAVKQTRDFSDAIWKVLEFARKRTDTLVIVTADHETGGLTICYPAEGSNARFAPKFATTGHSACDVPIFSEGPGADMFSGLLNNIEIPKTIADLEGLTGLGTAKKAVLN